MAFDINGAKQAGYSDEEITDFLLQQGDIKFDIEGAKKAGYSASEIVSEISKIKPPSVIDKAKSAIGGLAEDLSAAISKRDVGQLTGNAPASKSSAPSVMDSYQAPTTSQDEAGPQDLAPLSQAGYEKLKNEQRAAPTLQQKPKSGGLMDRATSRAAGEVAKNRATTQQVFDTKGSADARDAEEARIQDRMYDLNNMASLYGSSFQDNINSILKIGPTALKGGVDLLRLATADTVGADFSDHLKRGMKAMDEVFASDNFNAQNREFTQMMSDKSKDAGDMFAYVMDHPQILMDQGITTIGSMLLPMGAAAGAGKIAKVMELGEKAAGRLVTGTAITAGGLQNAADTFTSDDVEKMSMGDRYLGASISFAVSGLMGIVTGGGAEGEIARRMLRGFKEGKVGLEQVKQYVTAAMKEGGQEIGEELGNVGGEVAATGKAPELNNVAKRVALAGTLGAAMGVGGHVVSNIESPEQKSAREAEQRAEAAKQAALSKASNLFAPAAKPANDLTAPAAPARREPTIADIGNATTADDAIKTFIASVDSTASDIDALESQAGMKPVNPGQSLPTPDFSAKTANPIGLPGGLPQARTTQDSVTELADLINQERADVKQRRAGLLDESKQDFNQLLEQETADVTARRNAINTAAMERQIAETDARVAAGREQQTAEKRLSVMDQLLGSEAALTMQPEQLTKAFTTALAAEGFANAVPTEQETARLIRGAAARDAMLESEKPDVIPSAPNEMDAGLVPERKAPTVATDPLGRVKTLLSQGYTLQGKQLSNGTERINLNRQELLYVKSNRKGKRDDRNTDGVGGGLSNGRTGSVEDSSADTGVAVGNQPAGSEAVAQSDLSGRSDAAAPDAIAAEGNAGASAPADGQRALNRAPNLGNSWVIRNKETGESVMETYDQKKVDALNTAKYEAVPVHEHLVQFNAAVKAAGGVQPEPGWNKAFRKPDDTPPKGSAKAQPEASADKSNKRAEAIASLEKMSNKKLRAESAKKGTPVWKRTAIADILQVRAEQTKQNRSAATRKTMAKARGIDPDRDHLAAAVSKLGGINMDQAKSQLGLSPEELNRLGHGIRRMFTKAGKPVDTIGEALAEMGYVDRDENGKADYHDMTDKIARAANGEDIYTANGMMIRAEEERARAMEEVGAESVSEYQEVEALADDGDAIFDDGDADNWLAKYEADVAQDPDVDFSAAGQVEFEAENEPFSGTTLMSDEEIDHVTEQLDAAANEGATAGGISEVDTGRQAPDGAQGTGTPEQGAPSLELTGETQAEGTSRLERELAEVKAQQAEILRRMDEDRAAQEQKEIDARQAASAENFELGQDANDAITGQKGLLFSKAPATNTAAFRKWFGESKVVDENGEPLRVYHGTVKDFDAFDNTKTGANDRGLWGRGHYFSSTPTSANSYALRQGDDARVIPAYVSIQNPLVLRTGADLVTRMPDGTNTRELIGQNLDGSKIKAIALNGGHDGVVQLKRDGTIGDVVAFEPTQIKSAIGNNGEFDGNNPDIRRSTNRPTSGQTVSDIESAIAGLRAKWQGFRNIEVVQSVEDLPANLREAVESNDAQRSEGFYDPSDNTVWMIADNIREGRATHVAAHEISGHAGLRALGDKSIDDAIRFAGKNRYIADLARAIAKDRGETMSDEMVEEAMAELQAAIVTNDFSSIEDRYQIMVPEASRNGIRGSIGRVLAAVKKWLAGVMGIEVDEVSDADVRALLDDARKAVETAGVYQTGRMEPALASMSEELASELRDHMDAIADRGMVEAADLLDFVQGRDEPGAVALADWLSAMGDAKVSTSSVERYLEAAGLPMFSKSERSGIEAFRGMTKKEFLGEARITKDSNAADLRPKAGKSLANAEAEPFMDGKYTAKYEADGIAVFDGDKVIASYDRWNTLVVDKGYRRQGIAAELIYQWRIRNPEAPTAKDRTKASQAVQEKVWSRIQRELMQSPKRSVSPKQTETANIRFSKAPNGQQGMNKALPAETPMQEKQRIIQDKFNRFKVVQDWLKSNGVNLSEKADVYQAEATMHGRISTRKQDFRELQVRPLIEKTQKAGVSMAQVADYLKFQHAPEANVRAREVNRNPDATAYGVADDEARKGMAALVAENKSIPAIANEWRQITEQTKQTLLDGDIITKEMTDAWEAAYSLYIPVKGDEDAQGVGKGLSVNGKQKGRTGHGLRDEAIIENILRDYERAVTLDEKNRVGHSLLTFALEVKDDSIISVAKPEKRKVLRNESAFVVSYEGNSIGIFKSKADAEAYSNQEAARQKDDKSKYSISKSTDPRVVMMASPMLADNEVTVYAHGHAIRVQLNDEILARAYTNMGVENVNVILQGAREVNSWLSKAYTGYNPEFAISNPIRDFTAGMINLTGDYGIGMTAKIAANYGKAVKELVKARKDPRLSKIVTEYRAAGGSTGAAYLSDLERIGEDVMTAYNEYAGAMNTYQRVYAEQIEKGKGETTARSMALLKAGTAGFMKIPVIGHFLNLMERINAVTENALRVATFMTLRENGFSAGKAAIAAKDSTVNFSRKGELTNQAGALYLFFNPNIQGTARLLQVLGTSEYKNQARVLTGMMAVMAYTLAEMARGGDDDDEKEWQRIPGHVKDRNMVFKFGDMQFMLPIPYGYGVFYAVGNALSDYLHGEKGTKIGIRMASSVMENFSPVGNPIPDGRFSPFQLLPTIPKMALAPTINENSFGQQITPKRYSESKPDSQLMYRNTKGTAYDKAASGLNELTGGNKYQSGMVDVSPETLKYWVSTLTGGTGKFVIDTANLPMIMAQGVAPELNELPVVRRFVRESSVSDARGEFWKAAEEAKQAASSYNDALKGKDRETARKIMEDDRPLIRLADFAKSTEKAVKAKRDAIDRIRQDESTPLPERRVKIKELEIQETKIYDRFLTSFRKAEQTKAEGK